MSRKLRPYQTALVLVVVVGTGFYYAANTAPSPKGSEVVASEISVQPPIGAPTILEDATSTAGVSPQTLAPTAPLVFAASAPQPIEQYRLHLEAARSGNPTSQILVASAIASCVNSFDSFEKLERFRTERNLSAQEFEDFKKQFHECKPFYAEMRDLRTVRDTWIESAASQGSDIAILYREVYQTSASAPLSKEEFRAKLVPSLRSALDSPELMDEALQFVAVFFARHAEWRHMEWTAWNVLYCRASAICEESDVMLYEVTSVYKPVEVENIMGLVAAYSDAIEERNWDALDLNHP